MKSRLQLPVAKFLLAALALLLFLMAFAGNAALIAEDRASPTEILLLRGNAGSHGLAELTNSPTPSGPLFSLEQLRAFLPVMVQRVFSTQTEPNAKSTSTLTPFPTVTVISSPSPVLTPTPAQTNVPPSLIFYVAPEGNDANPGTLAQPWRTIQKAASTLVSGQTVVIRGGVYFERVVPQNSGAAGNPITYTAFPGETPIIDGTGVALNFSDYQKDGLIQIIGKKFLSFSGLTIRNSSYVCINLFKDDSLASDVYAEKITLSNLTILNCAHVGILGRYTRRLVIKNNVIDKIDYSSGIGIWKSEDVVVDGNTITNAHYYHEKQGAYDEALTLSSVTNFEVKNNTLENTLPLPWDISDTSFYFDRLGIDVKDSCQNGKVYKNIVRRMTAAGIYVDAYSAGTVMAGILSSSLNHVDIFQNRVSDGGGIIIGAELANGVAEYINIYNNLVVNAYFTGIHVKRAHGDGLRKNITIYNNIIIGAAPEGGHGGAGIAITTEHLGSNDSSKPVIIQNNIAMFYFPSGTTYAGQIRAGNAGIASMIQASNNIVYGPQSCSDEYPTCVEVGERITADPLLVFVNPSTFDFHLRSGSPAIDAGVTLSLFNFDLDDQPRPQGNGFDIGVYEVQFSE